MVYDTIIVGGGPAGLSAGIYAQRADLKALLIEKFMPGGQAINATTLDNYPGNDGISGAELILKFEAQAKRLGLEIVADEATGLSLEGAVKSVTTPKGTYEAKTIILCLGAQHRKLGIDGEDAMVGRGLSYCATCDGAFFRGMDVAVIGGGDTAVNDALFLARVAKSVTLIHRRDELRAAPRYRDMILGTPNVRFLWDSIVTGFETDFHLTGLRVRNVKTNAETLLPVQGVFVAVGNEPQTGVLEGLLPLKGGYVETDEDMKTSIPGVFAAGDVRVKSLRQIITAAADGAIAGVKAAEYVIDSAHAAAK